MNKTQLEYFIEVYRRKSYKKASEYLMITQQGVNKTIKSLEDELETKLFVREGNIITPTKAADDLYVHAKVIIDEYRMIENTTNRRQKKVTIYAIDSVTDYYLADFLVYFQKKYSGITLKIIETTNESAQDHVLKGLSDFAILQEEVVNLSIINNFLFEVPFVFVINKEHPLAKKKEFAVEDIDNSLFAGRGFEYVLYERSIQKWRKDKIVPITVLETNNPKLIMNLVNENQVVGSVNEAVANRYRSDNMVIRKIDDKSINDRIYLTHTKALTQEAKLFKKELIKWLKQLKG